MLQVIKNWRMGKQAGLFHLKKWCAQELKVGSSKYPPDKSNPLGSYTVSWGDGNEFERTLSVFS